MRKSTKKSSFYSCLNCGSEPSKCARQSPFLWSLSRQVLITLPESRECYSFNRLLTLFCCFFIFPQFARRMERRLKDYPARDELLERLNPYQLLRALRELLMPNLERLHELLLGLRSDPLPPEPAERRTKYLSTRCELKGQWPMP